MLEFLPGEVAREDEGPDQLVDESRPSPPVKFTTTGPLPPVSRDLADARPSPSDQAFDHEGHHIAGDRAFDDSDASNDVHIQGSLWAKDEHGNDLAPSLDDIKQGDLGDCFLMAALAAIVAVDPEKIRMMVRDNAIGTYTISFEGIGWLSTAEQTVSADFLKGRHAKLGERKALWPLLIEKAYAQEKGGLEVVNKGGNAGDAVDDLTNVHTDSFDPGTMDDASLAARLIHAHTQHRPITFLSPDHDSATDDQRKAFNDFPGLHYWHTYALEDVSEEKQQFKLFNPWNSVAKPFGDGWVPIEAIRRFFIEVDIN